MKDMKFFTEANQVITDQIEDVKNLLELIKTKRDALTEEDLKLCTTLNTKVIKVKEITDDEVMLLLQLRNKVFYSRETLEVNTKSEAVIITDACDKLLRLEVNKLIQTSRAAYKTNIGLFDSDDIDLLGQYSSKEESEVSYDDIYNVLKVCLHKKLEFTNIKRKDALFLYSTLSSNEDVEAISPKNLRGLLEIRNRNINYLDY